MDSKKRNYLELFNSVFKPNKHILVPLIFFFSYIFLYRACTFLFLKTTFHDFYFFDHSVWSFVNGHGLFIHAFNMSFWADHFYPWLLLFVPFYSMVASPFWMFIVQGLLASFMAYPILVLASERLGKTATVIVSLLLFFYLPFRLFGQDFHGELWQATFLSWIIFAVEKRKDRLLFPLIFLFPFLKENAITYLAFIALYLFIIKKRYLLGVITAFWGAISSLAIIGVFIPFFVSKSSSEYLNTANYSSNYAYLGDGIFGKLRTVIFDPLLILNKLFSGNNIAYFILIFAPLGFMSLLSPISIITIGIFLQNFLSVNANFVDITAHYTIVFIPIVFISAIFVYEKIQIRKVFLIKAVRGLIVFFVLINFLYFILFEIRKFIPPMNLKAHYQALKMIPANASVAADTNFKGHLQYRTRLYSVGDEPSDTEFIIVKKYPYISEKKLSTYFSEKPFFAINALLLGNVRRDKDIANNDSLIKKYLDNKDYYVYSSSNIWVFKKLN